MLVSALRFFWNGWIDAFFVEPDLPLQVLGLRLGEGLAGLGPVPALRRCWRLLALLIALGLFYRVAIVCSSCSSPTCSSSTSPSTSTTTTWSACWRCCCCFLPAQRRLSLDARRLAGAGARPTVPALALPRAALPGGAGLHLRRAGQAAAPTGCCRRSRSRIWLASLTDLPLLGPLLAHPAGARRWRAGPGSCSTPPSRCFSPGAAAAAFAYAAVLVFHVLTAAVVSDRDVPGHHDRGGDGLLLSRLAAAPAAGAPLRAPVRRAVPGAARPRPRRSGWRWPALAALRRSCSWCCRSATSLYGGNVLWHEQGMRFSWRVMVREKNGSVTYRVRAPATGRTWEVSPARLPARLPGARDVHPARPDLAAGPADRPATSTPRPGAGSRCAPRRTSP